MINRIKRLSYNQLVVLYFFLRRSDKVVTVTMLEKYTPLEDKSLGGVLSSLTRTKFRGQRLIEPLGKAQDGGGLRWKLNNDIIDVKEATKEVKRLLATYI